MLAIDTNLVIRFLTADDPRQTVDARRLIEGHNVFVCTTVLLEAAWVLRSIYRYPNGPLVEALRAFAGLPRVTLEDPRLIARVLDWAEAGIDFADALHLASAADCDAFVTFDRRLIETARRVKAGTVRTP
ncbi:MAG TPA: type II toxin-antitoxin system VapC family toxin [Stellaceae bacterium]|jgi:predicted nucleic acid-binding protein|nr:type II toxin-antitoxin system VapC family toxin [Stellaceae bacterium]